MTSEDYDPLAHKVQADAFVERAALHLRELLREAVSHLDPFPPFPGAFFTHALEAEPAAAAHAERGCVVVCPDGELYELVMGVELPSFPDDPANPVSTRKEELRKLDDLHPRDYLVYAYNALTRVVEILLEQQEARGS
ncbi:MAG: hypothetical protein JSU97_05930 [Dehalococcoidia bacterium]|nr:MAG: hypothetical protein JSU97_05930 [Dehalococcoidia bacterium]